MAEEGQKDMLAYYSDKYTLITKTSNFIFYWILTFTRSQWCVLSSDVVLA